jgi:hypothetical protein
MAAIPSELQTLKTKEEYDKLDEYQDWLTAYCAALRCPWMGARGYVRECDVVVVATRMADAALAKRKEMLG